MACPDLQAEVSAKSQPARIPGSWLASGVCGSRREPVLPAL